jgi:hypothetical protein
MVRRLVLTDADYLIFEAIARHGPLPSHYLYEFTKHLRRDRSHLQNRLTEFYNGDWQGAYLARPPQQFASYGARYQHIVYDLMPRARLLLAERGAGLRSAPRSDPFVHRLMGACVMASIELTTPEVGLRFIPFGEILSRPGCEAAARSPNPLAIPLPGSGGRTLTPDGMFGLEYPGSGYRFFTVEIDRNTESIERKNLGQSSFGQKIAGYLNLLKDQTYRRWWGLPNLHVLTVTTSYLHASNILALIARQSGPRYSEWFATAVEPQFGANWRVPRDVLSYLVTQPWHSPTGQKGIGAP